MGGLMSINAGACNRLVGRGKGNQQGMVVLLELAGAGSPSPEGTRGEVVLEFGESCSLEKEAQL